MREIKVFRTPKDLRQTYRLEKVDGQCEISTLTQAQLRHIIHTQKIRGIKILKNA